MSGLPVDMFDPIGGSVYGLAGARPAWAPGANRATAMSHVPSGYYFNPSAFTEAIVQPGQPIPSAQDPIALAGDLGTDIGNVGRNLLRGPSQTNVDCSISKRFPFFESKSVELRADIFNLLNTQIGITQSATSVMRILAESCPTAPARGSSSLLSGSLFERKWLEAVSLWSRLENYTFLTSRFDRRLVNIHAGSALHDLARFSNTIARTLNAGRPG